MDPVFDLTIRAALALLFAVAAFHKLRDLPRFAATVAEYRLLPAWLARAAATGVVVAELAVVAALGLRPSTGLVAGAMLLVVYGTAISVNLVRGRRHIDCGCSGPAARRPIGGWLVARNAVVAASALAPVLVPATARSLVWMDVWTVIAATAMLAACWTASDRLVALAPGFARLREAMARPEAA